MSKVFKRSLLILFSFLMMLSALLLLSAKNVSATVSGGVFEANGAGVLINYSNGVDGEKSSGIRFNMVMSVDLYESLRNEKGFKTGVLIAPKDKINSSLDLPGAAVNEKIITDKNTTSLWEKKKLSINSDGKYYVDNTNGTEYMTCYVYLYNIPVESYNRPICFRGYYQANGKVEYTSIVERSIAYVADKAIDSGDFVQNQVATAILEAYTKNYSQTDEYVIVISTTANETEVYVAEQLQNYIKTSTGKNFDIVNEAYDVMENKIYVGATKALSRSGISLEGLGTDGFVLKSVGEGYRDLFIAGQTNKGTLYGAYEFLESNLGIRFLTEDATYVPKNVSFNVPAINGTYIPDFENRLFYSKSTYKDQSFLSKSRMDGDQVVLDSKYGEDYGFNTSTVHNQLTYINDTYYVDWSNINNNTRFNEHKSLFTRSSSNVVKTVSRNGRTEPADICMTSGINADGSAVTTGENAFAICLENMKKKVMEKPDSDFFVFTMMDTTIVCECSRCTADRSSYKDSGITIRFANNLAKEVNKWLAQNHPERGQINIVVFAYNDSVAPPTTSSGAVLHSTCVPNEHVYIRFAPIRMDCFGTIADDSENKNTQYSGTKTYLANWGKITDNLFIWTYNSASNEYLWYFPTYQTFDSNFELFKSAGISYVFMQGDIKNMSNWQNKMESYIAGKKLWDTSLSAESLKNEYVSLYYGPAANKVNEFLATLNSKYTSINSSFWFYQGMYFTGSNATITKNFSSSFINGLISTLDSAISAINASSLTASEKQMYIDRVNEIKITPLTMKIQGGSTYGYNTSQIDSAKHEFSNIANKFGITHFGEGTTVDSALSGRYTVTFSVDGTQYSHTQKVYSGEYAMLPKEPSSKNGGAFEYWTVNGVRVDLSTYKITADTVFVAQFTKELTDKDIYDDQWWQ